MKAAGREDSQVVELDKSDPKARSLRYDDTRRAGLYRMQWTDPVLGEVTRLFASSPDIRESDLTALRPDELKRLLGKLNPAIIPFGANPAEAASVTEMWRTAIWVLLGLVLVESALAAWIGRESR
jgi:hypothetical protein